MEDQGFGVRVIKRARRRCWAFFVAAIFLLPSCGERLSASEQQELAQISRAIDRLRLSDNGEKAPLLKRLQGVECVRFCDLKKACVNAYEKHVEGLRLIASVKASPAHPPEETERLLDQAEETLNQAKTLSDQCVNREMRTKDRWVR